MPVVTIKIAKGRSVEQKRELTRKFCDTMVSVLGVKPEWVSIIIDEYNRENWSTGGELHSDKFGSSNGL